MDEAARIAFLVDRDGRRSKLLRLVLGQSGRSLSSQSPLF
jgi:hypothetical protein